jgi:hypothetical protein
VEGLSVLDEIKEVEAKRINETLHVHYTKRHLRLTDHEQMKVAGNHVSIS